MSIKQEIFNKVYAAVVAQAAPAVNGTGNSAVCTYRGVNNTKCAIGHILSDEQIEKYGVMSSTLLPQNFPIELVNELVPGVKSEDAVMFMRRLQRVHDDAAFYKFNQVTVGEDFVNAYKRGMRVLAADMGLTVPSEDSV